MDALYNDSALAAFHDWDSPRARGFRLVPVAPSWGRDGAGSGVRDRDLFGGAGRAGGAEGVSVDPAAAMLAIARARPGGDLVRWIDAGAQELNLGRRFDAVVMTGHAFQTLLTPADRAACLATIARHLAPGGRFLLDSRNPEAREWESWTPEATRAVQAHPEFGAVERWNEATWDVVSGIVTYETHYRLVDGRHFQATSQIGFPGFAVLSAEIAAAGLAVDRWYGDPSGGPVRAACVEFIPLGRLAG